MEDKKTYACCDSAPTCDKKSTSQCCSTSTCCGSRYKTLYLIAWLCLAMIVWIFLWEKIAASGMSFFDSSCGLWQDRGEVTDVLLPEWKDVEINEVVESN